jgi:exopolysaccharide biosynthesis protein
MKWLLLLIGMNLMPAASGQVRWQKVDTGFGKLPEGFSLFMTRDLLDGKPFTAWYAIAALSNPDFLFTTDTSSGRRLTPAAFYTKNEQPLLVVNGTFFSFATQQNLNIIIKDGKQLAYNMHSIPGRGKDTLRYTHPLAAAIGITKDRTADVAWTLTDSNWRFPMAFEQDPMLIKDTLPYATTRTWLPLREQENQWEQNGTLIRQWKMQTAIGGGPVLLHNGRMRITNNEEAKFGGKAISDAHPRTAMGYTKQGELVILVVEGRFPGVAEGASLQQLARLLLDIGCYEALNLDGGGSSCMLVNGRETIRPSDKTGQRPVPGVFLVQYKP